MADLGTVAAQLRSVEPQINGIIARHLRQAHPPVTLSLRRNILAIPVKGTSPPTGLRARIASCVEGWAKEVPEGAQVGVAVDSSRMPTGEKSLPLMMEGVKRFRHPVFGNDEVWVPQESHEYFARPAALLSVTARIAVAGALQEVSSRLS
jgi:hypothetical protein